MNEVMNEMYLRRANKIVLDKVSNKTDPKLLATAMKNLESLGYTFSKDVISALSLYGDNKFSSFYNELISDLKRMLGAHKTFSPMYPNFPKQVMDASDAEIYINAILHYFGDWIGVRIIPSYTEEKRSKLLEKTTLTVIGLGSEDDFISTMKALMSSKTSISSTDMSDLTNFLPVYKCIKGIIPDSVPNKEVASFLANVAFNNSFDVASIYPLFKTSTDVLRFAVALSNGDISLAKPTKFSNFNRSERRFLIGLINNIGSVDRITEDMIRFKDYWIRLGEKLHFGDYDNFKNAYQAISILRNNKPFSTFNSKVEKSISNKNIVESISLLTNRPGELARRLDQLMRSGKPRYVISAFKTVISKVSAPVLFQVLAHFRSRESTGDRIILPKGNIAKIVILPKKVDEINNRTCKSVVKVCQDELSSRYSNLGDIGKVYVDKDLENYIIPFSQRSASKALKTIVRGSHVKMDDKNFLRFFLWWKQPKGERIDIDLSANAYDKDFKVIENITYWNLRSEYACHSGDITSAPNGACEFIDIDIEKAKKMGIRYIAQSIYSYTQQKYADMPECFAGFMTRENQNRGQIFEARTVQNKYDLTSDTGSVIPMVFDLDKMEMIWADLAIDKLPSINNCHTNQSGLVTAIKGIANMKKATLLDLFSAHAKGRGKLVSNPEDADVVFSVNSSLKIKDGAKLITPLDIEKIMGEYL